MRSISLRTMPRSSSLNGRSSLYMVTRSPNAIVSRLKSSFCHVAPVTIFPVRTPIDPVSVLGRATIHDPGVAIQ